MSTDKQTTSQPMRGMRDLLPREVALRQAVISTIKEVYARYGFSEIETPVVERIELLSSGEGGDNEKQTFGVLKRGLSVDDMQSADAVRDLIDGGLRYDLTVPLARYVAENQSKLIMPFKSLQIGNVFRAERPQKGRYRQFTQCDIDIIGEDTNVAEQELMLATTEALVRIGFEGFTVRLNDRRILKGMVTACGYGEDEYENVCIIVDKLDKIGLEGVAEELKAKTSSEEASCKLVTLLESLSSATSENIFTLLPEGVDEASIKNLQDILSMVTKAAAGGFTVVFDPTLVRGMGYYTGTIFEIEDKDFPSSIAGGGRYDNMIGKYTGNPTPACGFSIGFERIIALLEERGVTTAAKTEKRVLIFDTEVPASFVLSKASELRQDGTIVLVQKRKKNTKNQLQSLANEGYTTFCLLSAETDEIIFKPIA